MNLNLYLQAPFYNVTAHENNDLSYSPMKNHSQTNHHTDLERNKDSCFKKFIRCLQGNAQYRKLMMRRAKDCGVNSVSVIDKASRILFPFSFTILNILYWIAYTR